MLKLKVQLETILTGFAHFFWQCWLYILANVCIVCILWYLIYVYEIFSYDNTVIRFLRHFNFSLPNWFFSALSYLMRFHLMNTLGGEIHFLICHLHNSFDFEHELRFHFSPFLNNNFLNTANLLSHWIKHWLDTLQFNVNWALSFDENVMFKNIG